VSREAHRRPRADEAVLHPHNTQRDGEIYVMRVDGADLRRLTDNQFEEAIVAWKPSKR
jgi:hypothetical protein